MFFEKKMPVPTEIEGERNSDYRVRIGSEFLSEDVYINEFPHYANGELESLDNIQLYVDENGILDLAFFIDETGEVPQYPLYQVQVSKWPGFAYNRDDSLETGVHERYFSEEENIYEFIQETYVTLPQTGFAAQVQGTADSDNLLLTRPFTSVSLAFKTIKRGWDPSEGAYIYDESFFGRFDHDRYGRGKTELDKGYYYVRVRAYGENVYLESQSVLDALKRLFIPIPFAVDSESSVNSLAVGNDLIPGPWSVPIAIKVDRGELESAHIVLDQVKEAQTNLVQIPLRWEFEENPEGIVGGETMPEDEELSDYFYEVFTGKIDSMILEELNAVSMNMDVNDDADMSMDDEREYFYIDEDLYESSTVDYLTQESLAEFVSSLGENAVKYHFLKSLYAGAIDSNFSFAVDEAQFMIMSMSGDRLGLDYLNRSLFHHYYPEEIVGEYNIAVRAMEAQNYDQVPSFWSNNIHVAVGVPSGTVPLAFLEARTKEGRVNPTEGVIMPLYWKLGSIIDGIYQELPPLDSRVAHVVADDSMMDDTENIQMDETPSDDIVERDRKVAGYFLYLFRDTESDFNLTSEGQIPYADRNENDINDYLELISVDDEGVRTGDGRAFAVYYFDNTHITDYLEAQQTPPLDRFFEVPLDISYVPKREGGVLVRDSEGGYEVEQVRNTALEHVDELKAYLLPVDQNGHVGVITRAVSFNYEARPVNNTRLYWALDAFMEKTDRVTRKMSDAGRYYQIYYEHHDSYNEIDALRESYPTLFDDIPYPRLGPDRGGKYIHVVAEGRDIHFLRSSYLFNLADYGSFPLVWLFEETNFEEKSREIRSFDDSDMQRQAYTDWTQDLWLVKERQVELDVVGYEVYVYYSAEGTPVDPRINPAGDLYGLSYRDENNNKLNDYAEVVLEDDTDNQTDYAAYFVSYIDAEELGYGATSDPYSWLDLTERRWERNYPENEDASDVWTVTRTPVDPGLYHVFIRSVSADGSRSELSDPYEILIHNHPEPLGTPVLFDPDEDLAQAIQQIGSVVTNDLFFDLMPEKKMERLDIFREAGFFPVTWERDLVRRPQQYDILVSSKDIDSSDLIQESLDEMGHLERSTFRDIDLSEDSFDDYQDYYSRELYTMNADFYRQDDYELVRPYFLKDINTIRYYDISDRTFQVESDAPLFSRENQMYYVKARAVRTIERVLNGRLDTYGYYSPWSNQIDFEFGDIERSSVELSKGDLNYQGREVIELELSWDPANADSEYQFQTVQFFDESSDPVFTEMQFDAVPYQRRKLDFVSGGVYFLQGEVWRKNMLDSNSPFVIDIRNPREYYALRVRPIDDFVALYIQNEGAILWSNVVVSRISDQEREEELLPRPDLKPIVPSIDRNGLIVMKWSVDLSYRVPTFYEVMVKKESEFGMRIVQFFEDNSSSLGGLLQMVDVNGFIYRLPMALEEGVYHLCVRSVSYEGGERFVGEWSEEEPVVVSGVMPIPDVPVYQKGDGSYVIRLDNINEITSLGIHQTGVIRVLSFAYAVNTAYLPAYTDQDQVVALMSPSEFANSEIAVDPNRYYVAQLWSDQSIFDANGRISDLGEGEDGAPISADGTEILVSLWGPRYHSGESAFPEDPSPLEGALLYQWDGSQQDY